MPTNPYEQNSRLKKALALADRLAGYGIAIADVRLMDQDDWNIIAESAGVHVPSTVTQAIVIGMLESREITHE